MHYYKGAGLFDVKNEGQGLKINDKKTSITAISDLDNSGSISERVNQLQRDISGPVDRDVIESSMGFLRDC